MIYLKRVLRRSSLLMNRFSRNDRLDPVFCRNPQGPGAPVVFDSPHSGTFYPESFNAAVSRKELQNGEDRFVDALFADAPDHGAVLIAANFARTFIDPNRLLSDLDVALIDGTWPYAVTPSPLTKRGVGLIFRRIHDGVQIYDRQLSVSEVRDRIDRYWQPYHDTLDAELDAAHERHGEVWHINCHSMLPIGDGRSPDPGDVRADFVLGDRNGSSCNPEFTAFVAAALRHLGYSVSLNNPYQGGELVRLHGHPAIGRNSLQIEINRQLYMNLDTLEKHDGFPGLRANLGRLAADICAYAGKVG